MHAFIKKAILCWNSACYFIKMMCTSSTHDVRVKVHSLKKSHIFYRIKHSIEMLSSYVFVSLKMLLTAAI